MGQGDFAAARLAAAAVQSGRDDAAVAAFLMANLTHFDEAGRARMVDVSAKAESVRVAVARGAVRMPVGLVGAIEAGAVTKGDVAAVAELAGIMAAKKTSELIPLCHPLPLSSVRVRIELNRQLPGLRVEAEVKTTGRTGVEMEALTAVSVACLTVYDMLKSGTRDITIGPIELIEKSGGKSGDWRRD